MLIIWGGGGGGGGGCSPWSEGVQGGAIFHDKVKEYY